VSPSTILCIVCILLVPLANAGLALINTGLGRSRSAAHTMMASLCIMAVAALVFCACGFAWDGFPGRPAYMFVIGGKGWNWIGAEKFLFRGLPLDGSPVSLAALLQLFTVGMACLIPFGAGSDRWRLSASCISTAVLSGWTYPLFAHWVWGGGWLAQLGVNYGIGHGFLDTGGAAPIQVTGGLTALSIAWILGPRHGKHTFDGMPTAIPGHNAVLVLLGCMFALIGWLGLNSAGALLFQNVEPGRVAPIAVNTILCSAAAALATAGVTRSRFGKPDASLSANGWVGGLVASSAGAAFMPPAAAIITGLVAGVLVPLSVEWLELHLGLDDPGGAISVHAVAGIWGILSLGFLGNFPAAESGQWLAQTIGVATLLGFVLPLTYGLNWLLNRFYPQRVAVDGERQGLDLYELGAGAYPDFMTHSGDEFMQR
jgi:Amt family ammonium transporter